MTREEVLKLQWRQLDAAIEENIFGNKVKWVEDELTDLYPISGEYAYIVDHYSDDILAAWEVVEKLRESHLYVDIRTCVDFYEVWITLHEDGYQTETVSSSKLPEAICKAALLAVLDL